MGITPNSTIFSELTLVFRLYLLHHRLCAEIQLVYTLTKMLYCIESFYELVESYQSLPYCLLAVLCLAVKYSGNSNTLCKVLIALGFNYWYRYH